MSDPPTPPSNDDQPAPARRSFAVRRAEGYTPTRVPYQQDLNEEQRNAVIAPERHVLVLAGAGSGKTRVITYRLAWLLEQGAKLETCMLATFTNKASREMLHRVETLLQRPTTGLWGGTFHSICARFLRQEASRIGFSDRYTILDTEDAGEVMSSVRAELLLQPTGTRFPQSAVLQHIASLAMNTCRPAPEVLAQKYPQFLEQGDLIMQMLQAYALRKRALNAMDYDDLLTWAVEILRSNGQVRKKWALHFRHLLVDEYQDTNHCQGEIVDHLASEGANVMVVGDDAQAIYAFRGADYRNILGFPERYPDAAIYKLTVNYRSTPPILHLANALFNNAPANFRKELQPVKKGGYKPALVACRDSGEEAMFIASRILDLREEGISLRQMGVLFRSHSNALELELELRKRRIPFLVRGGLRFTEQAHIKDVLAHLIVTANSKDELSWLRIFKLQKKVAQKRASEIWGSIGGSADPLQEFLRGAGGDTGSLGALRSLLKEVLVLPPADGIAAITESHYRDVVYAKYTNPPQRLEDLQQLATYASKFSQVHDFLEDIALLGGLSAEEIVATEDPDERITLSTVHQAKGLEWPIVFIPHVVEGILPHWLALKDGNGDEERRLLYVAITRAQDELYLSYPQMRYMRGTPILNQISSFLADLGDKLEEYVDLATIEPAEATPNTPAAVAEAGEGSIAATTVTSPLERLLEGDMEEEELDEGAESPYED